MAKETAFHRMAAEFNNNVQNVVSEIKQNISVDVDTTQLDNALNNINSKFNAISTAGPENLQKAIQEAANELDQMLRVLQNLGNSSGLEGVTRIVDSIKQGFSELLGDSVAIKDTFEKMNESILPVVQSTKDLSAVLEDVNRKASEGGQFFDQWIATARMLREDMGGVQNVLDRFKQTAQEASQALVNIDATTLDRNVSQALSNSTEKINDHLRYLSDAVKQIQDESNKIANGISVDNSNALEEKLQSMSEAMRKTSLSVEEFKANVEAAGLDNVFSGIIQSIDQDSASTFDRLSKALEDVPVERLRDLATGLRDMASGYAELSREAQNSDNIVSFFDSVLKGSNYSQDNSTAFYVNMLSDSVKGLNAVADDAAIMRMFKDLGNMGGSGSGIVEMQQALAGMKSQFKELQDLKQQAGSIFGDQNVTPEEATQAVRSILKKESEILAENKRALEQLLKGMEGGNLNSIESVQFLTSMKEHSDKLNVSISDLSTTMSKLAQESGLENQVKQMREFAAAADEAGEANKKLIAASFNESMSQGIPFNSPFRQEAQADTAAHIYNQNSYSRRRATNRARDIENAANNISNNEMAGLYGGARGYAHIDSDGIAKAARELQVAMTRMEKQKSLVDNAFRSGDTQAMKDYMPGLIQQQKSVNESAVGLGNLVDVNKKDLERAPEEVRRVVEQIKNVVKDVRDSNGNVISIGKILDDDDINKATGELRKFNQEFDTTIQGMNKSEGFWGKQRENLFTGNRFTMGGAMKKLPGKIVGAGSSALGMMGLGGMLSMSGLISGTFGAYRDQGKWESEMALANLATGGAYSQGEFDDVMGTGLGLNRITNGMIGVGDVSRNYASISRNVIGQTGRSSLTAGDKSSLSEMSTLFQGAGLASSGQIESSLNVFYKELGMSVKETEYQFSKILQTSQALNIPFEKQLAQVTELSKQFKGMGLGADAAANAYLNLTAGGMHEDLAKDYTSSLGRGMTSMNTGMLAYGGLMSGQYSDPFSAIADMKYGLWDKNGNVKEDMADKLSATVDSMADLYAGIAGGHNGAKRMIMGDFFSNELGMSQQQAGMSVERYLENPNFLKEILKDHWSSTAAGAEVSGNTDSGIDGMMNELKDAVASASENLSGIDKTLAAVENSQHRLAKANETALDAMTNFSDEVYMLADLVGNSFGSLAESFANFEDELGNIMNLLAAAVIASPLLGALGGAAGRLATRGRGKYSQSRRNANRANGGSGGGDDDNNGRRSGNGSNDSPLDEDGNVNRTRSETHGSRRTRGVRGKGLAGGLLALGGAGLAAIGFMGDADADGLYDSAAGAAGKESSGGGTLGGIYGVLKDILAVLSGGTPSGGHGGSAGGAAAASSQAAGSYDDTANYIASNWYNDNAGLNMTIAGGYAAAGLATALPTSSSRPTTSNRGSLSRVETAAARREASKLMQASKVLGKSAPVLGAGVALLDIGSQMKDQRELNKLAGLDGYWKDYADIAVEGGASAGVFAGGAAAGAAIGSGFFGIGAIPGALIGGGIAAAGDWGLRKFGAYDAFSGLFGLGDEELKEEKMKKSKAYRTGMQWADRYGETINSDIDEGFAVAAGQGLTKYGSQLSGLSSGQKDIWAASYAKSLSEGKSEEEAKKAADELYQINIGQKEAKELNKQQLTKMIEQYGVMEAQGVNIETLLTEYLPKDADSRNDILKKTEKATGLSQKELEKISESLGLTLDQLLAMIQQSSGGSSDGGFVSSTDEESLRKKLKKQGIKGTDAENVIAAYLENNRTLSGSNMTEDEKIKWAQAYYGASGVGMDGKEYADDIIMGYRRDDSVIKSIKGDSSYSKFKKSGDIGSYLKGTTTNKVLDAWAEKTGMSKFNIQQSLKANGMNEKEFAAYLQSNKNSKGTWNKDVVDALTNGKLVSYSKESLYTLETAAKAATQAYDRDAAHYEDQTSYNKKKEAQDKVFQEYDKENSEQNLKSINYSATAEEQRKSTYSLLTEIKSAVANLPGMIGAAVGSMSGGGSSYQSDGVDNNTYGAGPNSKFLNQDLRKQSSMTADQINDWIDSKVGNRKSVMTGKGDVFLKAAKESGLDVRYLVAHAAHETAWGTSNIAKSKGNMYGIGAFDATPYSSAYGYSSSDAGIVEGAKWIAKNYVNKGQETLYQMRNNNGVHQYATDPEWDDKIAAIMASGPVTGGGGGGSSTASSGSSGNSISSSLTGIYKFLSGSPLSLGDSGGIGANMTGMSAKDMVSWYNDQYNITSRYGATAGRSQAHSGLDYDGKMGDPIKAIMGGTVISASKGYNGGYGNNVQIKHSDGTIARYSHLKDINVSVGTKVTSGSTIGTMGNTGNVVAGKGGDGSHLDLQIKGANGKLFNPETWMNSIASGSTIDSSTGGSYIDGMSSSGGDSASAEEQAQYFKPIDANIGKYDPFSGIGDVNSKLQNTHNSIYGGASSMAIGRNGVNYQEFVKQSASNFQSKENAFKVDVKLDAAESLGSASKAFMDELQSGIQKTVKEVAQKYAAKAANDMGSDLVRKLRSD